MYRDSLITTVNQKVLQFLTKYSDKEFHEREIARRINISAGSSNRALHKLHERGVIKRRKEGRMLFYSIDSSQPVVVVLKKLVNILLIEPLVENMKGFTNRIVLFGSCAQGTDTSKSDMDVFIVTNNIEAVRQIIENYNWPHGFEEIRIQAVVKTPIDLLEAGKSDQVFLDEVEQGIIVWASGVNER